MQRTQRLLCRHYGCFPRLSGEWYRDPLCVHCGARGARYIWLEP